MGRRWWVGLVAMALVAAGLAFAYWQRISPPYATVTGEPYTIALDANGCPMIPERPRFVDAPGELVPPDPVEVVLCSLPTEFFSPGAEPSVPLKRVLTAGAAEFAAILNRLPDRNAAWRDWQRRHSGLWPDSASSLVSVCPAIGYAYDFTYLLRYADRPPVALVSTCDTGGLTTGARTRIDVAKPHVIDEFVRLSQT
ncbi:hypothetical protein [Catellatospora citrea]|uniref:Uncharacterized protein n=1 Tax=Catellatospora citrea TaxID=53366 RepID=A0A8J3NZU8_9ACTN|nr:hypothetical protein [Catellatospora citrea]RKE05286.1 hypothetical protein C8E86_0081 [Catellatospora citrea]GIF98216.1 hypothetical protein Cci01nite_33100 [Catellatospora citrea]